MSFALSVLHAHVVKFVHMEVSKGSGSGLVVVWCAIHAPRYAQCEDSPLFAVTGIAGSSHISAKEVCPLPPRTYRRGCPQTAGGALWRYSIRPERTGFGCA